MSEPEDAEAARQALFCLFPHLQKFSTLPISFNLPPFFQNQLPFLPIHPCLVRSEEDPAGCIPLSVQKIAMKTDQPKLKTQLFSCGFFGHCTRTVLSPTASHPPTLPLAAEEQALAPPSLPPPPPAVPHLKGHSDQPFIPDSESSSSSASQSFTQWKFPLPNSPLLSFSNLTSAPDPPPHPLAKSAAPPLPPPPLTSTSLQELFHAAELQLTTGSESDHLAALHLLERSLVPNLPSEPNCPLELMRRLVGNLQHKATSKPASKILLALCLAEGNRPVAVDAGAVSTVVESVNEMEDSAAERALASLELMCTVAEGAEEVRAHALAVPVMVTMMGKIGARVKEYAISILAVMYGNGLSGEWSSAVTAPPEEVARAVVLALQGSCSARGKRKGSQLLKALQDS